MSIVNSVLSDELAFYWFLMNASPAVMPRDEFLGGMEMLILHTESETLRAMCKKNRDRFSYYGAPARVANAK